MILVATYDVTDDDRRSKVAARLQSWGERVQKSVFVIDVAPEELTGLRGQLQAIIDDDVDSLYLFRQCGSCWQALDCVGQASPPERVLYWAAL